MRRFKGVAAALPAAALLAGVLGTTADAAPGNGSIEGARADAAPRVAYFDGSRPVQFEYRLRTAAEVELRIELVDRGSGAIVRSWSQRADAGAVSGSQRWSGLDDRGEPAADGAYKFVLRAKGAARAAAVAKFRFHDHVFPIPGPHSYREGEGEFGASRPGRIHEGKDVWAACGQKLIAARGGEVQKTGYDDELYGNFVVIDGRKTETDFFYVHLLEPADVQEGRRVRTGDPIGEVGATGNARSVGCMLHLELWPDGFRRGDPIDPEPLLRVWDGFS